MCTYACAVVYKIEIKTIYITIAGTLENKANSSDLLIVFIAYCFKIYIY